MRSFTLTGCVALTACAGQPFVILAATGDDGRAQFFYVTRNDQPEDALRTREMAVGLDHEVLAQPIADVVEPSVVAAWEARGGRFTIDGTVVDATPKPADDGVSTGVILAASGPTKTTLRLLVDGEELDRMPLGFETPARMGVEVRTCQGNEQLAIVADDGVGVDVQVDDVVYLTPTLWSAVDAPLLGVPPVAVQTQPAEAATPVVFPTVVPPGEADGATTGVCDVLAVDEPLGVAFRVDEVGTFTLVVDWAGGGLTWSREVTVR